GIAQVQRKDIVFHFHDAAEQSARGQHVIAFLQRVQHDAVLFGALLLGPDEQKIEHGEHEHDGHGELKQAPLGSGSGGSTGGSGGSTGGSGGGIGNRGEHGSSGVGLIKKVRLAPKTVPKYPVAAV